MPRFMSNAVFLVALLLLVPVAGRADIVLTFSAGGSIVTETTSTNLLVFSESVDNYVVNGTATFIEGPNSATLALTNTTIMCIRGSGCDPFSIEADADTELFLTSYALETATGTLDGTSTLTGTDDFGNPFTINPGAFNQTFIQGAFENNSSFLTLSLDATNGLDVNQTLTLANYQLTVSTSPLVPEPAAIGLLSIGLAACAFVIRRRRQR